MKLCKYQNKQVSLYASLHVYKYASMKLCKYFSMQVCMYVNMHVYRVKNEEWMQVCVCSSIMKICMFAIMHVSKYACMQVLII